MNSERRVLSALIMAACAMGACAPKSPDAVSTAGRSGPFLGETPPGNEATLFAPGFISTGLHERDVAITPDGKKFYYSVFVEAQQRMTFAIMVSELVNGSWTVPQTAPFSGLYSDVEPCISVDGQRFIFASNRPLEDGGEPLTADVNLWEMTRTAEEWTAPQPLGQLINTDAMEAFPSLTAEGTLYFTRNDKAFTRSDIYRSRFIDGEHLEAEKLPEIINAAENPFNAFIAPDESYLIFSAYGTAGGHGASDYLISFRSEDDKWSPPRNLGPSINSVGKETSVWVSRDGAHLFFASDRGYFSPDGFFSRPVGHGDARMSYGDFVTVADSPGNGRQDIYWIDASFLDDLRQPPE